MKIHLLKKGWAYPDDLFFFSSYNLKNLPVSINHFILNGSESRRSNENGLILMRSGSCLLKGMQKQVFHSNYVRLPDYLILDEPIDGQIHYKKAGMEFTVEDVAEREMTILVSSQFRNEGIYIL